MEQVKVKTSTGKKGWQSVYEFACLFPNKKQNEFGKIENTDDGRFRVIIGRGLKVIFNLEENARKYILKEVLDCIEDVLMESPVQAEFIYIDDGVECNRVVLSS